MIKYFGAELRVVALETSCKGSVKGPSIRGDNNHCDTSISVQELLKRLAWAAISVPAPEAGDGEVRTLMAGLSPEELLKLRSTALQLEAHHNQIMDFLKNILDTVNSNGYISPVRIK